MCRLLGIQKTRTMSYNPKSDGIVERLNRTLLQMLSVFVSDNQDNWDDHVPFVMMAYRSTCNDSTSYSPNKFMFGREIPLPVDVVFSICSSDLEEVCA